MPWTPRFEKGSRAHESKYYKISLNTFVDNRNTISIVNEVKLALN